MPVHPTGETFGHSAYWGERTAEANAMILDTGPGDARYFAHVFADIGVVPDEVDAGEQLRLGAGAEAGARWALSPTLALKCKNDPVGPNISTTSTRRSSILQRGRSCRWTRLALPLDPTGDGAIWTASGSTGGHPDTNFFRRGRIAPTLQILRQRFSQRHHPGRESRTHRRPHNIPDGRDEVGGRLLGDGLV